MAHRRNLATIDVVYNEPIPTYPMTIPAAGVGAGELVSICANRTWLRRVADVISYMDQPDTWTGTPAEIATARDESRKLMQMLLDAEECIEMGTPTLAFDGCDIIQLVNGIETSRITLSAAECPNLIGPPGPPGPEGPIGAPGEPGPPGDTGDVGGINAYPPPPDFATQAYCNAIWYVIDQTETYIHKVITEAATFTAEEILASFLQFPGGWEGSFLNQLIEYIFTNIAEPNLTSRVTALRAVVAEHLYCSNVDIVAAKATLEADGSITDIVARDAWIGGLLAIDADLINRWLFVGSTQTTTADCSGFDCAPDEWSSIWRFDGTDVYTPDWASGGPWVQGPSRTLPASSINADGSVGGQVPGNPDDPNFLIAHLYIETPFTISRAVIEVESTSTEENVLSRPENWLYLNVNGALVKQESAQGAGTHTLTLTQDFDPVVSVTSLQVVAGIRRTPGTGIIRIKSIQIDGLGIYPFTHPQE